MRATSSSADRSPARAAGSSTFAGRCSVTRPYSPGDKPEPGQDVAAERPIKVREQRVHHDIADQVDLIVPVSLVPQVRSPRRRMGRTGSRSAGR